MNEKKEKHEDGDKSLVQLVEDNINKTNEPAIQTGGPQDLHEEVMEEYFFLMYHLHMQYSEIDALPVFKRKWIIERFVQQKKMEKEVMDQMRRGVGPGMGGIPSDFLKELERTRNG